MGTTSGDAIIKSYSRKTLFLEILRTPKKFKGKYFSLFQGRSLRHHHRIVEMLPQKNLIFSRTRAYRGFLTPDLNAPLRETPPEIDIPFLSVSGGPQWLKT
jgi:hypothetical protein